MNLYRALKVAGEMALVWTLFGQVAVQVGGVTIKLLTTIIKLMVFSLTHGGAQ